MTLYIYPRTQTGCKSSWWDTHALDIWQFHCQITLKTVYYQPYWKGSAWVLLHNFHRIFLQNLTPQKDLKKKWLNFTCSSTFYLIISWYFTVSFILFHPKLLGGGGVEGVHLWAWPQGQKLTSNESNSDVQWATIWRTQGWKVTYGPKCNIWVL